MPPYYQAWNRLVNARWLEQNYPTLGSDIKSLPWVSDGIDNAESKVLQELLYLAVLSQPAVSNIIQMAWVQDGVDKQEAEAINWVDSSGDADVAFSVTELAWVRDGIEEPEVKTIEELSYIAQDSSAVGVSVVALPWVQDGIETIEFEALQQMRYINLDASEVAASVIALPWVQDGIEDAEFEAIDWINNFGSGEAMASVVSLNWVRDGIEEPEVKTLEELSYIDYYDSGIASSIISLPWVQDGVGRQEIRAIEEISYLSRKNAGEASRIVSMPFLETLEPPDVSALESLVYMVRFRQAEYQRVLSHPTLTNGITDDWTKIVAILYDVSKTNPDLTDALLDPAQIALVDVNEPNRRWPSAEQPVGKADVVTQLASVLFVLEHGYTPPDSVRPHPASEDFPGPVPADAPRITRSLTIDTSIPRWHSTGLYAAPGELVTVTVSAEVAKADSFGVRVGAHSDRIWQRSEWTRMPEISRYFSISAPETLVANAFGGLIYVEVPADASLGNVTVQVKGAVAAPLFVLGETDLNAWRNEIRHAPAPWAEIAGRNMIITTDAREVRGLDDPAAVAEAWDRVLDLSAELAAWPSPARSSPERFVVDRQISVGYMHDGYPIMAHLDQQANLVNSEHLSSECNWGFYHEVGHNHQADDWTFDGTVEVTVNLFTLYVYEFLCGIPVDDKRFHGSHQSWSELMALYDFDDPDFELWKREEFLALIMYAQMRQEFGWDAYRQVFATYRALPDAERPKSDDEKRDQWLVRFSRQVGRNLGPFFEAWGVPTSQAARDSIADLPVWMPANFPPGP